MRACDAQFSFGKRGVKKYSRAVEILIFEAPPQNQVAKFAHAIGDQI